MLPYLRFSSFIILSSLSWKYLLCFKASSFEFSDSLFSISLSLLWWISLLSKFTAKLSIRFIFDELLVLFGILFLAFSNASSSSITFLLNSLASSEFSCSWTSFVFTFLYFWYFIFAFPFLSFNNCWRDVIAIGLWISFISFWISFSSLWCSSFLNSCWLSVSNCS